MTTYSTTPTWPPRDLSDSEVIIDFIRQQARHEIEAERDAGVTEAGVTGVRGRLAEMLDDAERIEDFPVSVLAVLRTGYDLLWTLTTNDL